MFYLVMFLCVISVWSIEPECGLVTFHGSQTLIIGGKSAQRGEVPWHAAIYTKTKKPYQQICGGSLVSKTIILSAAHCFWDDVQKQLPVQNYAVGVGKLYRSWDVNLTKEVHQRSDAKEIHLPVRYQGNEANNQEDIAIIIVTTPFQYTTFVRPVCLDFDYKFDGKQLHKGKYGKVAGWGLTAENGPSSQVLKVIELPYVDTKTCIAESPYTFRPHITGDKFCAGYKDSNLAVCKGDSGGGLVFPNTDNGLTRYYLRGIVSSAPAGDNPCNANAYTSFTKILKHEHFIKLLYGMTSTGDRSENKCDPIPLTLTSKKTGQKARDKCIEYQEKLVFPCENSRDGRLSRTNRCHHNADVLHKNETEAALYEYPHMALMGYGDTVTALTWRCGGFLVSEKFVITAAHCTTTTDHIVSYVALGLLKRSDVIDDRNRYKIKQVYRHPEYKRTVSHNHNIALLELEETVVLNEFLVPACIHTGEVVDDALAAATGWGVKANQGAVSNVLKKMILKKLGSDECNKKYQSAGVTVDIDPNTQLCYKNIPTSSDTCAGDSGGPLQIKNKKIACMYTVIGVTSFGPKNCGQTDIPSVYTTVAYYLDWIEKTVWG